MKNKKKREPISPHGGVLVNRVLSKDEQEETLANASEFKSIIITKRQISDLYMIATG